MQNIPVADAKPDDIKDLLGGALFKALFKWFEVGPAVCMLLEVASQRSTACMHVEKRLSILACMYACSRVPGNSSFIFACHGGKMSMPAHTWILFAP